MKCDSYVGSADWGDVLEYGIESAVMNYETFEFEGGSALVLSHLVCLLCYTDYTNFSYHFSKSFRKINEKETDEEFRMRKRNYHFLSKGLREIVELYGTKLQDSKLKNFYTGISCELVFPSFVCRLFGPTSTSAQISVATTFATKKGMLVTLNMNGDYFSNGSLKYFNCSLLSCYPNEDERLFIGGQYTIKFGNIRTVRNGKNFTKFVKPITKFAGVLSGWVEEVKKYDSFVVSGLLEHYLGIKKNEFDPFSNQLFKAVVKNTKFAKIDMEQFKDKAKEFSSIFLSKALQLEMIF